MKEAADRQVSSLTYVQLIGATDQLVPFTVMARPIGAEQVYHGFSAPNVCSYGGAVVDHTRSRSTLS